MMMMMVICQFSLLSPVFPLRLRKLSRPVADRADKMTNLNGQPID